MQMTLTNNKKATFDYYLEEKFEAGIVLVGTEVKSIKLGKCNIKESYIQVNNGECYIIGMNVSPYDNGNIWNIDSVRPRKLLLHKTEISKLAKAVVTDGYTIVPVKVYSVDGKIKLEIAIAKGKHNYDKRKAIKEREVKRAIARY